MKNFFTIFWLLLFCNYNSFCQKRKAHNQIGLSIPVIGNNSEATRYLLGNPLYPSGKAISYGININFSRTIYKNFYGIIGVGYYKQKFGIARPFNYPSPNQLGYATDSYVYYNSQLYGGVGYKRPINKILSINGSTTYNQFYSFKQKYIHSPLSDLINHKSMSIGRMINLNMGVENNIKKISVGLDAVLPISTRWNNDEVFYEGTQQIARNKFSIGAILSVNYPF